MLLEATSDNVARSLNELNGKETLSRWRAKL